MAISLPLSVNSEWLFSICLVKRLSFPPIDSLVVPLVYSFFPLQHVPWRGVVGARSIVCPFKMMMMMMATRRVLKTAVLQSVSLLRFGFSSSLLDRIFAQLIYWVCFPQRPFYWAEGFWLLMRRDSVFRVLLYVDFELRTSTFLLNCSAGGSGTNFRFAPEFWFLVLLRPC